MATKIFEIKLQLDEAIKQSADLKKQIDDLTKAKKELDTTTDEGRQKWVEYDNALKIAKQGYRELSKETQRLSKEMELQGKATKDADNLLKQNVRTIAQAEEQNRRINKVKKNLNVNDAKQKALLEQLNKKLEENTNFIRQNSDAEHRRVLNIGNYQSALAGLNIPLAKNIMLLNAKRKALIETTSAEKGASVGARMLGMAMKSIPLIALLSVIAMLIKAFASTQEGMDAIRRVTVPVKVVFETLWGVIQKVALGMYHAFSNPKKALVDLYEFVKQNLINRFTALGKILDGIIHLDFKKMGNGMLQVATGVEDLTDKVVKLGQEASNTMSEAIKRGREMARLTEKIESLEQVRASTNANFTKMIKEQELIAKDKTKSEQERVDAMNTALSLAKNQLEFENMILEAKMKQAEEAYKSNDTDREAKKRYDELLAQSINNKAKEKAIELRFLGVKNQIYRQSAKNREQAFKNAQAKILAELQNEVKAFELKNAEILKADTELNDKLVKTKIEVLNNLQLLEKKALDEKFKQKYGRDYQNELAYKNALLELEQNFENQKADLRKKFYVKQIADQMQADEQERQKAIEKLELELQEIEFAEMTKAEKKIAMLELQKEKEIELLNQAWEKEEIDSETHQRKLALINKKYKVKTAETEMDLKKKQFQAEMKLQDAQINAMHALANAGQAIFGKSKSIAIAMAVIDTWGAANKVLNSPEPLPMPVKIAQMVSIIATGLANVANIAKTNPGSSGSSVGGGSTPAPRTAPTGATSFPTNTALNRPQPNTITQGTQQQQTVRVVNVARDTTSVASNEIFVENLASV